MADQDFKIQILTDADLKGFKATEAALVSQIAKLKAQQKDYSKQESQLRSIRATLAAQPKGTFLDQTKNSLQEIAASVPGFERLGSVAASIATGPFAVLTLAATALALAFKAITKGISEYAQAEVQVSKLNAALAQQGKFNQETSNSIQALADDLEDVTGVADDEWIGVLTRLVQFGANPKTIGMDAEAVKNLAGIVGEVSTAAELYSKALQGNFDMFGRYGIVIDKTGTQLEKIRKLQEQLALRGGGQLAAANETLTGSFKRLGNVTGDFFKNTARDSISLKALRGTLNILTTAIDAWGKAYAGPIQAQDGLRNSTQTTTGVLIDQEKATKDVEKAQADAEAQIKKLTTATNENIAAIIAQTAAQDQIANAELARDIAQVRMKRAQTGGSAEQEIIDIANLREKHATAKLARDKQDEISRIKELKGQDEVGKGIVRNLKNELAIAEARKESRKDFDESMVSYKKLEAVEVEQIERLKKLKSLQTSIGGHPLVTLKDAEEIKNTEAAVKISEAKTNEAFLEKENLFNRSPKESQEQLQVDIDKAKAVLKDQKKAIDDEEIKSFKEQKKIIKDQSLREKLSGIDKDTVKAETATNLIPAKKETREEQEKSLSQYRAALDEIDNRNSGDSIGKKAIEIAVKGEAKTMEVLNALYDLSADKIGAMDIMRKRIADLERIVKQK